MKRKELIRQIEKMDCIFIRTALGMIGTRTQEQVFATLYPAIQKLRTTSLFHLLADCR